MERIELLRFFDILLHFLHLAVISSNLFFLDVSTHTALLAVDSGADFRFLGFSWVLLWLGLLLSYRLAMVYQDAAWRNSVSLFLHSVCFGKEGFFPETSDCRHRCSAFVCWFCYGVPVEIVAEASKYE